MMNERYGSSGLTVCAGGGDEIPAQKGGKLGGGDAMEAATAAAWAELEKAEMMSSAYSHCRHDIDAASHGVDAPTSPSGGSGSYGGTVAFSHGAIGGGGPPSGQLGGGGGAPGGGADGGMLVAPPGVTHAASHSEVTSKKWTLALAASHARMAVRMEALRWAQRKKEGRVCSHSPQRPRRGATSSGKSGMSASHSLGSKAHAMPLFRPDVKEVALPAVQRTTACASSAESTSTGTVRPTLQPCTCGSTSASASARCGKANCIETA